MLARRMLPQHAWTSGIAWLTVAFSVGQAVGPLVSGNLSDSGGGIAKGLWLSVILLALSAVAALAQRERPATVAVTATPEDAPARRPEVKEGPCPPVSPYERTVSPPRSSPSARTP
ncbi:YbfB/YjiJ family MFS transporter [Streptomyces sp. NPDC051917]|uniref:YbfB/YjiJ family MFS transporter n=1 Tax=Streptomyces sp. NPDC051917 TaxID=3154754 RepID=UPI0034560FEB